MLEACMKESARLYRNVKIMALIELVAADEMPPINPPESCHNVSHKWLVAAALIAHPSHL